MALSKVTWGGQELMQGINDGLEENWEGDGGEQYEAYTGPRPTRGNYPFKVRFEKAESSNGNPQVIVHMVLDPINPEHQKYAGYYCRDYLTFTPKTGFRTAPWLKCIGVTPREFLSQTGADENGIIKKIGKRTFDENTKMLCSIRPDTKNNPDYESVRYLRMMDGTETSQPGNDADDDADAGDIKTPF